MLGLSTGIKIGIKTARTAIDVLFATLRGRSTHNENNTSSKSAVKKIKEAGVLDKANIILTPSATSDARVHSVKTYTDSDIFDITESSVQSGNWVINTGNNTITKAASGSSTGYVRLKQPVHSGMVESGTYLVTITASGLGAFPNNIRFYKNGGAVGDFIESDGTHSQVVDVTGEGGIRIRSTNNTQDITISNISIVDVSSDFAFDRASSATRINFSGLVQDMQSITDPELVTNGDFENLSNGWNIVNETSDNYVEFTKGFARLKFLNASPVTQLQTSTQILEANKTYKLVVDVYDITSGEIKVDNAGIQEVFDTEGVTTRYITPTSNTALIFYRNTVDVDITLASVSVKDVTFSTDLDLARINYDENGNNGHILLEPTSTNLLPYSEDFTTWTINAATTVYSNTTETLSPSGEYNASKITSDGSNGLYEAVSFGGGNNTKSIYLKGIVGGEQVILRDPGQTITQKTLTLTTDWVRYDLSENQTSTIGLWINEIPSNGIYMWGAQLEALSYPTSYIPTLTGSTVTRAEETLIDSGSSSLLNSTEGVLYAEIAALTDDLSNRSIGISDGTANNRVNILYTTSTNRIRAMVLSGGALQFDDDFQVTSILDFHKVALKYKANDFALWIDGTEQLTDSSGSAPIGLDNLSFNQGNGPLDFFGKCKALAYFNEALSDEELQNLTS